MSLLETIQRIFGHSGRRIRKWFHQRGVSLPGWIQTAIWIICMLILIVLSVLFTIPVVTDYIADDKNMAINTSVNLNEKFEAPLMVLNIPHYILSDKTNLLKITGHLINGTERQNCSICQNLTIVKWDVWTGQNFKGMAFGPAWFTLITLFTRKMLWMVGNGSNPFYEATADWKWPLIESGMYFYSWKHCLDRYFAPPTFNGTEKLIQLDDQYSDSRHSWNGTHVYDVLYKYLLQALCKTMELNMTIGLGQIQTCEQMLTQSSLPMIMENYSIWIPLQADPVPASVRDKSILQCTLWRDEWDYENSVWTPLGGLNQSGGNVLLYYEPVPQYHWELHSIGMWREIASLTPSDQWSTATVTYGITMKIKETRQKRLTQCHWDVNPELCMEKCSKTWAIKKCGCIPFSFHTGLQISQEYANSSFCTVSDYSSCNLAAFKNSPASENCSNYCSRPCQFISYNFMNYIAKRPWDKFGFTIDLKPITDPYVEFSWSTKDQLWNFVSNLGGTVNLFLGLSGVSLCIFVVSCVDVVQQHRRKKTGNRRVSHMKAIALWQMVLMNKSNQKKDEPGFGVSEHSDTQAGQIRRIKLELITLREQVKMLQGKGGLPSVSEATRL